MQHVTGPQHLCDVSASLYQKDRLPAMAPRNRYVSLQHKAWPVKNNNDMTALPYWYPEAFSHLPAVDYGRVAALWQAEPVLRLIATRLDDYRTRVQLRCPYCGGTDIRPVSVKFPDKLQCRQCQRKQNRFTGTPFAGLHHARQSRLLAVLVTLWGGWRKEDAVWFSDSVNKTNWDQYHRRLIPFLNRYNEGPVTPVPHYLFGFTPGQQGLRCPDCGSSWLAYGESAPSENPLVVCEDCGKRFRMNPVPGDALPAGHSEETALPRWFRREFAHTTPAQFDHLKAVWQREPVLRELTDRLDAMNPLMGDVYECVWCGGHQLSKYETDTSPNAVYYCHACQQRFVSVEKTLFYNIPVKFWYRFYTVAVSLWTSWKPVQARAACRIPSANSYSSYCKRLRPLIDELCQDRPVTPRPRLLVGFSPGEQGVRCVYCGSSCLKTDCVTKYSQENPRINCLGCGGHFRLYEWMGAVGAE